MECEGCGGGGCGRVSGAEEVGVEIVSGVEWSGMVRCMHAGG